MEGAQHAVQNSTLMPSPDTAPNGASGARQLCETHRERMSSAATVTELTEVVVMGSHESSFLNQ